MSNKPSKSKSMLLTKGKVIDKFWFLISGTTIDPSWNNQSRAWRSSLTPAWETQLLSGSLLKSLEGGSPRWTRQACQVDLKPINKPFCQESCGLSSCSPNNNCGIPRKEDQQLSLEVGGPSLHPQQLPCMGQVMHCSYSSMDSLKSSRCNAQEKPFSIEIPRTTMCHQPRLEWRQERSARKRRQWRWQSHV